MQLTKKVLCSLLILGSGFAVVKAQTKNVNKAETQFKSGKLEDARALISEAAVNEKTADKAKTWYLKGEIYSALAKKDSGTAQASTYKDTAFDAFRQCLKLDSKFTSMLLSSYKPLNDLYVEYWRDGANAFNEKNYANALNDFKHVKMVNDYLFGLGMNMGSKIDTMAMLNIGNAAYNLGQKDTAAVYYQQLADIKYKGEAFVYKVLLAQLRDKDETKYMAVLDQAKALFPKDKDFANEEISYYSEKGDMDKLVSKLKEAISEDPNNYNAILNLAITYDNMANPRNDSGLIVAVPANHDDLFNQAVANYKKAVSIKPDDYAASFNLGLMYYNGAARLGKELGSAGGTSKAELAAQDSLLKAQDVLLNEATPYLQKAYQTLDSKPSLDPHELVAYKNAIIGLQGVYSRQNKMDEYNTLKAKLSNADSKAK